MPATSLSVAALLGPAGGWRVGGQAARLGGWCMWRCPPQQPQVCAGSTRCRTAQHMLCCSIWRGMAPGDTQVSPAPPAQSTRAGCKVTSALGRPHPRRRVPQGACPREGCSACPARGPPPASCRRHHAACRPQRPLWPPRSRLVTHQRPQQCPPWLVGCAGVSVVRGAMECVLLRRRWLQDMNLTGPRVSEANETTRMWCCTRPKNRQIYSLATQQGRLCTAQPPLFKPR